MINSVDYFKQHLVEECDSVRVFVKRWSLVSVNKHVVSCE